MAAGDLQTFTGLDFRRSTAHISVTAQRLWKVRLCLQYVLRQGRISGVQLVRILGHFNWAALLGRELLSVFHLNLLVFFFKSLVGVLTPLLLFSGE